MTTINTESYFVSIHSKETTAVDPWLPRIYNNDEYLQLGLTFARPETAGSDTNVVAKKNGAVSQNKQTFRPIGDIGTIRLSEALRYNSRLLYLDLSGNQIGSIGAMELAKALFRNDNHTGHFISSTTLQSLNLSRNHIGDEGARSFADALRFNSTLRHFDLSCNAVSIRGITALLECVDVNQSLRVLHLSGNLEGVTKNEMSKLVQSLTSSVVGNRLEVLDIQSKYHNRNTNSSFLEGASDDDIWSLLQMMYGVPAMEYTTQPYCLSRKHKLQNHRLRRLHLPNSKKHERNDASKSSFVVKLNKLLEFNAYYHPINELNDLVRLQSSPIRYFDSKLPNKLQRDVHSGALIGLLPSPILNNETVGNSNSVEISYKEMPHVISFAAKECQLDTLWNLLRYRPDLFRYAGKSFRKKGTVAAECGACIIA